MTYRHGQIGREPVLLRGDWFGPLAWSVACALGRGYVRFGLEASDGALRVELKLGLFQREKP